MTKILLVEDDKGICDFVVPELEHEGYEITIANTGRQALEKFANENPDLILLDIMIPEINGFEVLRKIRAESNVPIILETARNETLDKVTGLNAGADDYITKPFEIEELFARINALLRRVNFSNQNAAVLRNGDLEMVPSSMSVTVKGNKLNLSKIEFLMLKVFLESNGKVLSRNNIIDEVWGPNHFIDLNTVDVYIGYLRQKLSEFSDYEFIKTVRGCGYIMDR